MIPEFGFTVIDATLSIREQQQQVRAAVQKKLEDARKVRVRRWVRLSSTVQGLRE